MSPEIASLVTDARKRYETDPVAHALVSTTVRVLNQHNHAALGQSLSRSEQAIVRWAAAMALHLGAIAPDGVPKFDEPPSAPVAGLDLP